jgi:hypothetical protein
LGEQPAGAAAGVVAVVGVVLDEVVVVVLDADVLVVLALVEEVVVLLEAVVGVVVEAVVGVVEVEVEVVDVLVVVAGLGSIVGSPSAHAFGAM